MDRVLKELKVAINEIEAKIRNLIDSDKVLKRQHELLLSVDGVSERTIILVIGLLCYAKQPANGQSPPEGLRHLSLSVDWG
jgi:hypothetical protein